MRIFPVITALLVLAFVYLVVFERDRLVDFASDTDTTTQAPVVAEVAEPEATEEPAERAVPVVVLKSRAQEVDGAVLLRGRTEAARQVEVRAETTGHVISDPLRKGAYVEAGDPLCQLDPGTRKIQLEEALARVPEAKARLSEAEINNRAASRLSEGGFASETRVASAQAAVESAKAAVQSAESAVASARRELERLTITAPFSGLLESDTAELGTFLTTGGNCATVIQLDQIKLVGFVPEADVDRIEVGAVAGARLATGAEVMGRVSFLSRSADPNTRTFRVEVAVPNEDLAIRDGQTVEILVGAEGNSAHLLPQSAMTLDDDGRLGVRIVDADSKAMFVPVTVIRDTTTGIWLGGLPEQIDVIVIGQEYVIDGVTVAPTFQETTQ